MSLKDTFNTTLAEELKKNLWISNVMAIPKLKKITLNVWAWSYLKQSGRSIDDIVENLTKITSQKPVITKSKKSISNFNKLREWENNGVLVTLRGDIMYNFLEKLIALSLPRSRDFQWVSKRAFDQDGNYSLWIPDISIFPEIRFEDITKIHGCQINFSTTAKEQSGGFELLKILWLPFKK